MASTTTPSTQLSPDGSTLLVGGGGSLVTSAGTWTFGNAANTAGYEILLNGAPAAGGWATKLQVSNQGTLYAENAFGNRYEWTGGGWTLTLAPISTSSTPTLSPDGSAVLAGGAGTLVTAAGTWTFGKASNSAGSEILLNGASAAGGWATKLQVDNQGTLYAENALGEKYEWVGGGWNLIFVPLSPDSTPNVPPVSSTPTISPDGSTLLADSGGSLVTAAGTWTFGQASNSSGSAILLNGASAAGGSATKLQVDNQGTLYAENAFGDQYEWVSGGWNLTVIPTSPDPTPTNPPVSSTPIVAPASSTPTLSPDGSILLAGKGGSLVTTDGTWTFGPASDSSGSEILLNGASAAGGWATKLWIENLGKLFAENALGDAYQWVGDGWNATTLLPPAGSTPLFSPDGSTLLAGTGGSLITSDGTWTFGGSTDSYGYEILLNGVAAGGGRATKLWIASQGKLYAENALGNAYQWAGGGWSATTLVSPDTTTLLAGSAGSMVTSYGIWTFGTSSNDSGSEILLDGAPAAGGWATQLEVDSQGKVYAKNAYGDWYEWIGGGWNVSSAPATVSSATPLTIPTTTPTTTPTPSTSVYTAPNLADPSQTGDIVSVRLQNPGTTNQASGYVTFGQLFKAGAVKATDTLIARVGGTDYAVQMDVKAKHADGSVRHAILTLKAPAINAGGHVDLMLAKGTATSSPAASTASDLLNRGYDVTVNFTFRNSDGSTTTEAVSAAAALKAALNGGKIENWLSGPAVSEFDISTTADGGKLKLKFNIRAYADGTTTTDVVFDNSWMFQPGKTDLTYDVAISQNGQQVYSATNVNHYLYSTWHREVQSAGTIDLNVQYDLGYLRETGAIPAYDTSLGVSAAAVTSDVNGLTDANTGPLDTALVTTYMPMTGGRNDIGTQTAWTTRALISQDAGANDVMFANADAAGGIPWHYTDESTGAGVSVVTYPNFWMDDRGALVPTNGWPGSTATSAWTPDAAHMPDLSYVPYLLSGDRYYLTELQSQADWALAAAWPEYGNQYLIDGKYPAGFTLDGINETRGIAWSLRQLAEAAYITPDSDSQKSYYESMLQRNMDALVQQYLVDDINGKYGEIKGFINRKPFEFQVAPWQQGFLVSALGEIAGMGMTKVSGQAVDLLKYIDNFISGLFNNGANGYNPLNGSAYWLSIADPVTQAPYTTWAEFHSANVAQGNVPANPTSIENYPLYVGGGYPSIMAAALATLITYTDSSKAIKAYGYVIGQIANEFANAGQSMTAAYQDNPTWAQMPQLPDGTYLEFADMQIDTSSGDVVLTASGARPSLLAKVGAGNATFNGGTGTDLMFGGTGKNTFNDSAGNDYYDFSGTGNILSLTAASSGHDTVFDFNSLIDSIVVAPNLNGNAITTASQLIAGATVSNGNTVLHLGGQNDITLIGVADPASVTGALLVK